MKSTVGLPLTGNTNAAHILDDLCAIPSAELGPEESEEQELQELEGLAEYLQTLIARAEVKAQAGNYGDAAMAHFERGQSHELASDAYRASGRDADADEHHRGAMGAYRDSAIALAQHVNAFGKDCGYEEGYSLPQIRAIHWRMNQE